MSVVYNHPVDCACALCVIGAAIAVVILGARFGGLR